MFVQINSGDLINHNVNVSSLNSSKGDMQKKSQDSNKLVSQINDTDLAIMPLSEKVILEAIQKANRAISGGDRRFEFSIHEKTNEIVIKVFDSNTNELIREIPNEKILDMVAKICEMSGVFIDERR